MTNSFDPYYKWLGIGPEEQPPHYYRLLGVRPFETDADVIEAAADRQMAHLQTYRTSKHAAFSQRLLNEVSAARGCLLDPVRKAAYDAQLHQRLAPRPAPLPVAPLLPMPAPVPVVLASRPKVRQAPRPHLSGPIVALGILGCLASILIIWQIGRSLSTPSTSPAAITSAAPPNSPTPSQKNSTTNHQPAPQASAPSWTHGVVMALSFDDETQFTAGDTRLVSDLSGSGNNGVVHGCDFVPGNAGRGVQFKTAKDYIEVAHTEQLTPADAITLAAWIKPDAWRGEIGSGCLISKDDWDKGRTRGYVLRGGGKGRLDVTLAAPGWVSANTGPGDNTPIGVWQHVAATYDRDLLSLYVNAKEVSRSAVSAPIRPCSLPLRIGTGTYAKERHFTGSIDEVAIWDRALEPEEIRALYEKSTAGGSYCREIGKAAKQVPPQ